jgi:uncharacterized protein (TIGR03437 family)
MIFSYGARQNAFPGPVGDRGGTGMRTSGLAALMLLAGQLGAQPASITSTAVPVFGPVVSDAAGSLYFFDHGPVTGGAAQTRNGGGTCPFSNGFFSFFGPCPDAYVGKLDRSGNQVFGTYLGGATADQTTAIAVDGAGNVFLTGSTGGSFPTTANSANAASQTAKAFAAKISADGSRVLYSTYLPDTAASASAIAVDAQGNAYIGGKTSAGHAFVVKVSADGSAFLYHVALGGTNQDAAAAVVVDAAGNAIVAGQTNSPDFPVTPGAFQSRLKGAQNLFVARLDSSGRVVFSTLLGGGGTDSLSVARIDAAGNVYLAGQTSSPDFPTTSGSFEPAPVVPLWNNASPAGFVAKLKADGTGLSWSTYVMSLDHAPQPGVTQLAVTGAGETYAAGLTGAGFPVTASAPQACFEGLVNNAFVAHFDSRGALADATYASRNVFAVLGLSSGGDGSVQAVVTSDTNVEVLIRFGGAGWSAPACVSPAVLNSATMSGGAPVVPGELVTLTGFGIGPESGVVDTPDAQGRVPRELAGVQVLFDGQPAPVLYVQSRQINAQAPVELSGATQTNINVMYNQATFGPIAAVVAAYGSPGIFRWQPGVSGQAAALNEDGTVNSPSNPAARGSVVSIWGTGFGLTDPPCATGELNPPGAVNLSAGLSVLLAYGPVSGVPVKTTPAVYAGSAPALLCGVEQINMVVPDYALSGAYPFYPWSAMELPAGDESVVPGSVEAAIWVR